MDKFSSSMASAPLQSNNFQDIAGLDSLRQQAQQDSPEALKKVAKQFEGIFMQMLFKSMRQANEAFESDSSMNSNTTKTYRQMYDQQMSTDLSSSGGLGLADLIVQQLSPHSSNITPASALRTQPLTMASETTATGGQRVADEAPVKAQSAATRVADKPASRFDSPESFVESMMPYAKKAAQALGGSPLVMLAQAALETGWGQKVIKKANGESSHNLFNIKADQRWQGEHAKVGTLEYKDGVAVKQQAKFRAYDDPSASFGDYVDFLKSSARYQGALDNISNPASFLHSLQEAGYATDPNYSKKILGVLQHVTAIAKGSE